MPVLPNARHESFAQALAKGKTADEAYVLAGYKANRGNATRLNANESLRRRVVELQSKAAEKAEWSAADRLASLKNIHDASLTDDRRTAIAAIAEANKMSGSYPPAQHRLAGPNGGPIQTVDVTKLKGMTDEELDLLERALVQIGIVDGDQSREGDEEV